MSAPELEAQPVQVAEVSRNRSQALFTEANEKLQIEYVEEPFHDAIPDVKSGVRVDPNAAMVSFSSSFTLQLLTT